jgi:hypothetical protein
MPFSYSSNQEHGGAVISIGFEILFIRPVVFYQAIIVVGQPD